jgi:biopolymer transport protein TolR
MSFSSNRRGVKNDINVTPLVDVVLVLLIIFMVVTPMLERGKDVQLPKASVQDEEKEGEAVVVSVMSDRTVWLETSKVPTAGLRSRLAEVVAKTPDRKILIKADETLQVQDVRPVMTAAQAAGAKGVSFAVDDEKP